MPVTIPAFVQYQEPITPVNAPWRHPPLEGDKLVNLALDWGTMGGAQHTLQVSIGNNPVQFSQICAVYVDNRRCGVDVAFLFPDTGFLLEVPAHDQGLYPVLTNALQFYVIATGATTGDTTIAQVLNSQPPPISILPTQANNTASAVGINIAGVGAIQLIPLGVSGTLNSVMVSVAATALGTVGLSLVDGTGAGLWANVAAFSGAGTAVFPLSNIDARFRNGVVFNVSPSGGITGSANANAYYQTP